MAKNKRKKGISPLTVFILIVILAFIVYSFPQLNLNFHRYREPIKVEVLNGCGKKGLARRLTEVLRDEGFDVIYIGNAKKIYDETIVVDRLSKSKKYARTVAKRIGVRKVVALIDSTKGIQTTVIIGSDYKKFKILKRREFVF